MATTSTEQHKALLRRIPDEAFNQRNLAVLDEVIAPNFVNHTPIPGVPARGPEAVKGLVNLVTTGFPDFQYTLDDVIAEGDKVVHRVTARGTHRGEFMGVAPTGKQVTWTEMHIVRLAGGKCVEHWGQADMLGILQQLGVAPTPGQGRR